MTDSAGLDSLPTAATRNKPRFSRILSALVLLAWEALAATQAVAGWNLLVSVLTGSWLLMAVSLFLYGSKPVDPTMIREQPLSVLLGIVCVLAPLLLILLLRMWPAPLAAATWAVVMGLVFAMLKFDVRWLARVLVLIWAGAAAAGALVATLSLVLVSLQTDGNPLSGLRLLPTAATRVAAVVLALVAPISLAATVCALRRELTGSGRKAEWEDEIQVILESRRRIRDYLRDRWRGGPPDEDFERRSLNAIRLTTLDLVEIISAQIDERNLSEDKVYTVLSADGPASRKLALLFRRVRALDRQFGEWHVESVGSVLKHCGAIENWCVEQPAGRMAPSGP